MLTPSIPWRDRQNGPEWRLFRDLFGLETKGQLPGDLRLFSHSLLNSHTYLSISKRLGAGLNATSRISMSTSLPLAKEQWKVEVTRLFETSLARASFEARNVALGLYAKYPGYVRQNVDRAMCDRTYVYQAPGWSSINGMWYLILLFPSTIVIVLAFPRWRRSAASPAFRKTLRPSKGDASILLCAADISSRSGSGERSRILI